MGGRLWTGPKGGSSTRGSVAAAIGGRYQESRSQRPPPPGPDSGEGGPEQAVGRAELRAGRRSLVDGELLAQGQVLEDELAVAADEEGEEQPKQVEHEGDHDRRLWPGRAGESITCRADDVLTKDRISRGGNLLPQMAAVAPGLLQSLVMVGTSLSWDRPQAHEARTIVERDGIESAVRFWFQMVYSEPGFDALIDLTVRTRMALPPTRC